MNTRDKQKRTVAVPVEIRDTEGKRVLIGTPIKYDSPSELIYGYFEERIKPGAFNEHLSTNPDIMCLRDHNPSWILGRTTAKTLRVIQGKDGIDIECECPNTTYAQDLAESIRRKDLRGMSFGFDVLDDEWTMKNGVRSRDVLRAKLYEVTYTTMPAYPDTEVGIRDLEAFKAEVEARLKVATPNLTRAKNRLRLWNLG